MAEEPQPPAGTNDETIVGKPLPALPERIGHFTVLDKLGEGGMGAVWKAHDPKLDRTVALKLLPPHHASDADFIARFQREAATAAKFVHPNIVQVYAADEDAGTHFIAMEFVEGVSLQKHIANTGKLDCADALVITIEAAKGLQYAWTKAHLVHRDIKPDNILISNDGDVKVADLGLAKTLQSGSTNFTQTGSVMGSPHYISPEQGRGDKDVDFRSDIYSLGCTLFHMLTGRPPFEGDNIGTLIYKHIYEPPPDLAVERPDCPARVVALVKKMMAKDRAKRPATYDELIAELTTAHSALGKSETAGAAAKRRKMMMLAGAGVAVVAVVAVVLVWAPWKASVGRAVPSAPSGNRVEGEAPAEPNPRLAGRLALQSNQPAPVDDTFIKEVAALPAEEQVKRVVAKLKELNPGFDSKEQHKIEVGKVTELTFCTIGVTNIAPVAALKSLQILKCGGSWNTNGTLKLCGDLEDLSPLRELRLEKLYCGENPVKDLAPLKKMKLRLLYCDYSQIEDLTPLMNMPLGHLSIANTPIQDLTPLRSSPLTVLTCGGTRIRDLSPLKSMQITDLKIQKTPVNDFGVLEGMPLKNLWCDFNPNRNTVSLRSIKTLVKINGKPVAEFWKQVDAGKIPGAGTQTIESMTPSPVDDDFIKEVAALPAEEQVKRVVAKLKELNPGYTGNEKHVIVSGVVTTLKLGKDSTVVNIEPVRALMGLTEFECGGASTTDRSGLTDLSPLKGMALTILRCGDAQISDLTPLKGMPLTSLGCWGTQVGDLSPLQGMPLKELLVGGCRKLTDLSPLRGMKLESLAMKTTPVNNLRPLRDMPLKTFVCDFVPTRDAAILRSITTLEKINDLPAAEFWKQVDADAAAKTEPTKVGTPAAPTNDFVATVAALPPEKKLGAVLAKLKELNPNFDGKEQHKIEAGAVTELGISSVGVTDLTPVRALRWLKKLTVAPWTANQKGALSDLSALKELPLTGLWCQKNPIRDLAPLKGMALTMLSIGGTQVSDLEPLTGMKLTVLGCNDTAVGDLKPLEGMPLTILWCQNTKVTDLTPLRAAPLQELRCDVSVAAQNVGVLRGIKTLTKINDLTAAAFFLTTAMTKPAVAPKGAVGVSSTPQKEMTIELGDSVTMEFILIPAGSFMMGSDKRPNEKPVHKVTFTRSFYMGKYEVTQQQWEKIMGSNPSEFKGAKNPVELVSWEDCQNFITKLKEKLPGQVFRLPTEAEWEYVCRAGSAGDYSYGNGEGDLPKYAWCNNNAKSTTHPVGKKKPNAWGLYDMHGNVWEWCQDVYQQSYEGAPADGSAWTQGDSLNRVLRGGSWNRGAPDLRSACRYKNSPDLRSNACGLRVVVVVGTP